MSPRKPETVREAHVARAAFLDGVQFLRDALDGRLNSGAKLMGDVAAERYPLPKVTRPRIRLDPLRPFGEFKVDKAEIALTGGRTEADVAMILYYRRNPLEAWSPVLDVMPIEQQRMQVWADLFARPTEEVDAE